MPAISWGALANDRLNAAIQTAAGAALTNSGSETIISQTNSDITFNPNEWYPRKGITIYAAGEYTTPGSPGTLRLRLRYGGTGGVALLDSTAITPIATATATLWIVEGLITVRSEGSTGTVMVTGKMYGLTNANSIVILPATAPAPITVDTTTAKNLVLTAQWGTASSSYSITCHQYIVREEN